MLGCQELAESSGYEQWQGAVARSSPRSGLHTGAAHRASRALLAPELTKEGVRVSATKHCAQFRIKRVLKPSSLVQVLQKGQLFQKRVSVKRSYGCM